MSDEQLALANFSRLGVTQTGTAAGRPRADVTDDLYIDQHASVGVQK
jgi:hypothetical protein